MSAGPPAPAADGFYHPASEGELVELVRLANREGRQLRVRGSAHSVSHAVYTDPPRPTPDRVTVRTPPPGPNLNLMLDRYRGWRVRDEGRRLVEADAGIHLGPDPGDPSGGADLESSLLWSLATERGWSLEETGGITHQTISGFTATGSAGGSLQYSATRSLWGFRIVDGRGRVHEVTRDDDDPDLFFAMVPNLGLLGIVSKVILQCVEAFDIEGEEAITTVATCPAALFGDGTPPQPSLGSFLRETEYARLVWFPQPGADRVVTWQARRIPSKPGFEPKPYTQFGEDPEAEQYLLGVLFTVLGNLDDLRRSKAKLRGAFDELKRTKGKFLGTLAEWGVRALITLLRPAAPLLRRKLPSLLPRLIARFNPLDADKRGSEKGRPQVFRDHGWSGLPMDNQGSDVLLPTAFTELWVPLPRTAEAMRLLRDYFGAAEEAEALRRTGTYAWELYATTAERFWLNPGYSDGEDEWREGAFRIDPYWFVGNAEDPVETQFAGLWSLLREAEVPFRLHWGKFQPRWGPGDRDWVDYLRGQYPRWDDFLRLRAERDPNNIFLTAYWRERFGLRDEPPPRALAL